MNRNLPHAARVIRAALAAGGVDPVAAATHALDGERLLVDPERSYGIVLHRTPAGGWSCGLRGPTDLERQAQARDASRAHARRLATAIERHIGRHQDFHSVRADGDRVRVVLHVVDRDQWMRWRAHFGIPHTTERLLPHAVTGECRYEGVRVSVLAYEPRRTPHDAQGTPPARPFEFEGRRYDLAVPQRDAHGNVWYFQGWSTDDGMPLLSVDGRPERCSLANVATYMGPLSPSREPVRSPVPDAAGGRTRTGPAVRGPVAVPMTRRGRAR
ncbi:BN159_2729 family protein [Streptomyces krungchingensis]|uniref:BN159_2729 family protein n=1 Tax=Streptomyces krungchingensis TaxID=1565034 RepID=UPI003CE86182